MSNKYRLAIADRERARLVGWLRRMAREELSGAEAAGVSKAAEELCDLLPANLRAELEGDRGAPPRKRGHYKPPPWLGRYRLVQDSDQIWTLPWVIKLPRPRARWGVLLP